MYIVKSLLVVVFDCCCSIKFGKQKEEYKNKRFKNITRTTTTTTTATAGASISVIITRLVSRSSLIVVVVST